MKTTTLISALALTTTCGLIACANPAQAAPTQTPTSTTASYVAPNGLKASYRLYPSGTSNAGLLVYFDGDGQWGFDHPTDPYALGGSHGIVAQGQARGFDVLTVRTPSADKTWWTKCGPNADYMNALLNKAGLKYDHNKVWLTGYSGGAQFITQCYLPRYGNTLGDGGTVVFGGGGTPEIPAVPFSSELKKNFSMNWITGTDDVPENSDEGYGGLDEAQRGSAYYAKQGFETHTTYPKGIDHDELGGTFGTYIAQAIDATRTSPGPTQPTQPTQPTTPAKWTSKVISTSTSATINVTVPAETSGTMRVKTTSADGSYWYDDQKAIPGSTMTFRMGDPGDWLKPKTSYTYTISLNGKQMTTGSFTTK